MIGFVFVYVFIAGFTLVSYFVDMGRTISAPQQCVAIGSAIFWLLVGYTAMKTFFCWQFTENQKEILKALTERQRA